MEVGEQGSKLSNTMLNVHRIHKVYQGRGERGGGGEGYGIYI